MSLQTVEQRKKTKQEVNQARTPQQKQAATRNYSVVAGLVKKQLQSVKRAFYNEIPSKAEEVTGKGT